MRSRVDRKRNILRDPQAPRHRLPDWGPHVVAFSINVYRSTEMGAAVRYFPIRRALPALAWGLAFFLIVLSIELILARVGLVTIRRNIDLFGIVGIPLFFVTISELARTHSLQAAALITGHMSNFLTNDGLYSAFHDLISKYSDEDWEAVRSLVEKSLNRNDKKKTPDMRKEAWEALASLNSERLEGSRLYHPDFFQGSVEEKRLDSVLQFFDVLAYNYRNGLISVRDIRGVAGYHLAVIGTREVTDYYLRRNAEFWRNLPFEERVGAEPPFENLRQLLTAYKHYNRRVIGQVLQRPATDEDNKNGKSI